MPELNTIHKIDCISGMSELPAGSVDLAFADPPFNIGYKYDVYDDKREAEHYLDWSKQWIAGVHRALKPAGTFWLAIGDEFAAELKLISQQIGFKCRSWVIWYYTFGVNCTKKFNRSHAHLFHFVKDHKRFTFNNKAPGIRVPSARQLVYADGRANPDGRLPDDTWILRPQDVPSGFSASGDTWYFPRVAGTFKERAGFHGCQMPEQLLGRIIRACSNPDELVLDPFSGSATTLVVAKKLGRRWIGFDLSNDYVQRGRKRLAGAAVDDPLEGAPEPQVSAPMTPVLHLVKKPGSKSLQNHPLHPDENSTGAAKSKTLQSPAARRVTAALSTDQMRGLIDAFRRSNRGYSVDRVLADDELNEAFADRCLRLSLPGDVIIWNRVLIRLRKAGKLSQIVTRRRTDFDRSSADNYLFASEIALRRMHDRGYSLDDVLCDPRLRKDFDAIAQSFASGFTSLNYRWAALRIRKDARKTLNEAEKREDQTLDRPRRLSNNRWQDVGNLPGLYLLCRNGSIPTRENSLYAGATLNLAQRLSMVSDGNELRGGWAEFGKAGDLFVATIPLDPPGRGSWIAQLGPHQSRLVGKFSPMLNSELIKHRSHA